LLFNFLGELIYNKDSEQLLLRAQQVQISEKNGLQLSVVAQGEIDPIGTNRRCQSCYFTPFPIGKKQ